MSRAPAADPEALARIAEVVHEAMRAWQRVNGHAPAPPWNRAPKWMKDASAASVAWRLKNPRARASAQHDQWVAHKMAAGWRHGPVKDGKKKTHPMLVPYADLPEFERRKDALVNAVIDALSKPAR